MARSAHVAYPNWLECPLERKSEREGEKETRPTNYSSQKARLFSFHNEYNKSFHKSIGRWFLNGHIGIIANTSFVAKWVPSSEWTSARLNDLHAKRGCFNVHAYKLIIFQLAGNCCFCALTLVRVYFWFVLNSLRLLLTFHNSEETSPNEWGEGRSCPPPEQNAGKLREM